jgi:hypothetical protein
LVHHDLSVEHVERADARVAMRQSLGHGLIALQQQQRQGEGERGREIVTEVGASATLWSALQHTEREREGEREGEIATDADKLLLPPVSAPTGWVTGILLILRQRQVTGEAGEDSAQQGSSTCSAEEGGVPPRYLASCLE